MGEAGHGGVGDVGLSGQSSPGQAGASEAELADGSSPGRADPSSAGRADGSSSGSGGERRVSRRALLIGATVAVAGAGVLGRDELAHLWWRLPGVEKRRKEGVVDYRGAQWVAASTQNYRRADRPADYPIDRVVIHVTQGSYRSALKVFRDPGHGAAAHYVIRKDGHIAQMIRELDVAFHAGNREYNERSVGIEHEGFVDQASSFTDAMYRASARLTAAICGRYGIPVDRQHIIGHVEVPGTDHTDPGRYWDWDRYIPMVSAARDGKA